MLDSTADPRRHNASEEEDDDYTIYNSSPIGYEAMLKIRDDCDKLIANYNASSDGNEDHGTFEKVEIKTRRLADPGICPPTFDGWSCWNATPVGHTAFAPCPFFITGFDPQSKQSEIVKIELRHLADGTFDSANDDAILPISNVFQLQGWRTKFAPRTVPGSGIRNPI